MPDYSRINPVLIGRLRCPICHGRLEPQNEAMVCLDSAGRHNFAIINGNPYLLDPARSLFSVPETRITPDPQPGLKQRLQDRIGALIPELDINIGTRANLAEFSRRLPTSEATKPAVLIIGGRVLGDGLEPMLSNPGIDTIETDVAPGPRTQLICDAHQIPFEDATFAGVVIQAVLEHVLDPAKCVAELHRVLKTGGQVYAETPFMQPVHMGRYVFTRFSHLGHRRLFRNFEEVKSGAVAGPGLALALAAKYFLWSFVTARSARFVIHIASNLAFFWLKYLDYYLINKPGTMDAGSGYYFWGRKSQTPLNDRELIAGYRGCFR